MCKNTGQPSFDPTLKKPGKGHRLCNPFRTTGFFIRIHLTQTRMGRTRTRLPGLVNMELFDGCTSWFQPTTHKFL